MGQYNITNTLINLLKLIKDFSYFSKNEFDKTVDKIIKKLPTEEKTIKNLAKLIFKFKDESWNTNQLYNLISPTSMYSLIHVLYLFTTHDLLQPYFIVELPSGECSDEFYSICDVPEYVHLEDKMILVNINDIKVYYRLYKDNNV